MRVPTDKVILSADDAIAMLPEGNDIHTFMNPGGMLIGADWSRESIEKAIRETNNRELAGSMATDMGHGLCINHDGRRLFVATKRNGS